MASAIAKGEEKYTTDVNQTELLDYPARAAPRRQSPVARVIFIQS